MDHDGDLEASRGVTQPRSQRFNSVFHLSTGHRGVFVDGSFKMNGKIKALPEIQWKLVGLIKQYTGKNSKVETYLIFIFCQQTKN